MGLLREYVSVKAYEKALDADFQTVMESVGFNKPPREVLTIRDMEVRHARISRDELWTS